MRTDEAEKNKNMCQMSIASAETEASIQPFSARKVLGRECFQQNACCKHRVAKTWSTGKCTLRTYRRTRYFAIKQSMFTHLDVTQTSSRVELN